MKSTKQSGFGAIFPILLAVVLALAGLTAVTVIRANKASVQDPLPQPSPAAFNGEQFYNQVQNGMPYDEVVSLAGKPANSCEFSSAPPPTDYRICTWQDSSTAVTVSFKNAKVTDKSKRSP